jgi:ABC-type amino acid transport substrate-binding protein
MQKQSVSLNGTVIFLILAVCIGIILFNNSVSATDLKFSSIDRQDIQKLLTGREKAWLLKHKTVRIAGPKSFPPFHYYEEDGTLKGMASDYIYLILSYLNIEPDIQNKMEWPEVLKQAEEVNIDLISCVAKTMERESYLLFTKPYLSFPLVIITKTD